MGITQHPVHIDTDGPVKGPIEPYFDAFNQYLAQHGYAAPNWRRATAKTDMAKRLALCEP